MLYLWYAMIRRILNYIGIILIATMTMTFLMWAVYLIPAEKIRPNVAQSVKYRVIPSDVPYNLYGLGLDYFTDPLMFNNVTFLGRKPLTDAMLNPRSIKVEDWRPYDNLILSLDMTTLDDAQVVDYGRYWHGYLIFLKPLFVFFNLQQIRFFNLCLQLVLFLIGLRLIYKRLGVRYCFCFLAAITFLNPLSSWQCMSYNNVMNVLFSAVLWVLLDKNPNNKYMFFIIGMVTIIFDCLSFPLVTLGFPLILFISLYERSFKENIVCVIENSFLWCLGYALMMMAKWGAATLLTGQNILQDGWQNVLYRTYDVSEFGEPLSLTMIIDTWRLNLSIIAKQSSLVVAVVFLASVALSYFYRPYKFYKNPKALIFLGIFCMPFVWYGILVNHSLIHSHWTYKILSVSIYALLTAIVCCLKISQIKENHKKRKSRKAV